MLNTNISLKNFNTFGIDAHATYFFSYTNDDELREFLIHDFDSTLPFFVLGGGSNVLFTKDFEGTIIHPITKGIEIIAEQDNDVFVRVAAGENWDDFVAWAVKENLHGIENLSFIPGCVGASPVQNIGAYGAEAGNSIFSVNCMCIANQEQKVFMHDECHFGYRNSIFKQECAGQYIVTSVVFRLQKEALLNISYGSLTSMIDAQTATLQQVRDAIIAVRSAKLPDPKEIGSAGSFFKNPIIAKKQADELLQKFPQMVTYAVDEQQTKIAAGWLIESLGFKGYTFGGARVHPKQALVLTNVNSATSNDVVELAKMIQHAVYQQYHITIEPEVIYL